MKYYRFNQIAMAVLGAMLLIFGTRTIMQIAFEEHEPEKPGYEVAGHKPEEKPGGAETPAASELPALLAKADTARGETTAAICKACHALEKDAPSPIGPNLHNVVGRKIASVEGFNYSAALKAKAGEDWTYEHLDAMVHNPAAYAPGTIMAFPGLPEAQQRADVIVFLRTKTDNPPPLPEVAAVAPEGAAPAGAGAEAKPAVDPNLEVAALVAKADTAKGETDAALCKVCHTFDKGGPVVVGPNLYGVVGRKIASAEGFNYTPGLKAHEGDWTYDKLDHWLTNPQVFAPGTMMAFPGVPDAKTRADIIAFMRAKADSPAPLPEAAEEKPAEAAPAPPAEEKPAEAEPAPSPKAEADESTPEAASPPEASPGDNSAPAEAPAAAPPSSQPQPVYPDGPPQ